MAKRISQMQNGRQTYSGMDLLFKEKKRGCVSMLDYRMWTGTRPDCTLERMSWTQFSMTRRAPILWGCAMLLFLLGLFPPTLPTGLFVMKDACCCVFDKKYDSTGTQMSKKRIYWTMDCDILDTHAELDELSLWLAFMDLFSFLFSFFLCFCFASQSSRQPHGSWLSKVFSNVNTSLEEGCIWRGSRTKGGARPKRQETHDPQLEMDSKGC